MEAQQQYHYQQYQQPTSNETTTTITNQQPSYDPSQIQQHQQSYDPSSYYYQQQQQQQQQDYTSYYYQQQQQQQQSQDYYQTTTNDPNNNNNNTIHPPGVPLNHDYTHSHPYYYPHPLLPSQPTSHSGFFPAGGPHAGRGRGRGGGRGRGRGGRGKPQSARSSATTDGQPKQPSRMAWCEVCRTDCTTLEVLEQHKNGKRHKKNLKVQAELMGLSKQVTAPNPETLPSQTVEVPKTDNPPNDATAPDPASSENKTENQETSGPLPSQEAVRNAHFAGRGGFKRKMRGGGRGGKWIRGSDGSRRPMVPPKPKQVVPLICELCNVKCESQVVFQTHITGKKHITNMKRFQGHKEAFGEGIQALYPSISNLLPNIPQGTQDAQTLASMLLSQQNLQDPEAAQAALTQLLQQHGIHDAPTLIAQLVPYLLTQLQAPGAVPAQGAGLGAPTQNPATQDAPLVFSGSESQNVDAEKKENQTEQQATTATVEPEVASGTSNEPANVENVAPESESKET